MNPYRDQPPCDPHEVVWFSSRPASIPEVQLCQRCGRPRYYRERLTREDRISPPWLAVFIVEIVLLGLGVR